MDKQGVLDLAARLNGCALFDSYHAHVSETYDIAGEVADIVIRKYPGISLNAGEVALAGGLHDIGRVLCEDQWLHEIRGADWIKQHGLEYGVSDTQGGVERLAKMVLPHFMAFEQFSHPVSRIVKKEFPSYTRSDLRPVTWEQAIIVYADLTNFAGKRVNVDDRLAEIKVRYAKKREFMNCFTIARGRVVALCNMVEKLRSGRIDNPAEVFDFM